MENEVRRAANEESVAQFFNAWDPAWRWILILGLRQLRTDPVGLGKLATDETNGAESWQDEGYAYGPLSIGITAAATNEASQYCEDLFALLRSLRESDFFAQKMANYAAGKVIEFGRRIRNLDDNSISRLFVVPTVRQVADGLAASEDSEAEIASVEEGRVRLGEMVRSAAQFYMDLEEIHVSYKHGLRLPLMPFGVPIADEIARRKSNVEAPVFAYTSEPISAMLRRPDGEHLMMLKAGPAQRPHLNDLIAERNLLRLQAPKLIDLDLLVERSADVLQLLQIAQENRISVGKLDDDGHYRFCLPGAERWERLTVRVEVRDALKITDFADP